MGFMAQETSIPICSVLRRMRITRIFQPVPLVNGAHIELDEHASHHLVHVLRIKSGAVLVLFNGDGSEYPGRVQTVGKRGVVVSIDECRRPVRESKLETVLAQGISRGERMDYTLQKAVELGVSRIVPLRTGYTTVNVSGERRERRLQHWKNIVVSACEQCGRNVVPEVDMVREYEAWLNEDADSLKLVLHQDGEKSLSELSSPSGAVTLLVGPEGGLSDAEVAQARSAGFIILRLGPRILRTETAGLAALAALQAKWGDLC